MSFAFVALSWARALVCLFLSYLLKLVVNLHALVAVVITCNFVLLLTVKALDCFQLLHHGLSFQFYLGRELF